MGWKPERSGRQQKELKALAVSRGPWSDVLVVTVLIASLFRSSLFEDKVHPD